MLQLPETLHQQLAQLAESEGVSLNQYIVYALTQYTASAHSVRKVSEEEIAKQKESFTALLQKLGKASPSAIASTLAEREVVAPEEGLNAEIIARIQQQIRDRTKN